MMACDDRGRSASSRSPSGMCATAATRENVKDTTHKRKRNMQL